MSEGRDPAQNSPEQAGLGVAEGQDAVARLKASLSSLSPRQQSVAEWVLEDPRRVIESSVTECAEAVDSSTASVVRMCQNIGYRGFQHFKIALAQSLAHQRGDVGAVDLQDASSDADVLGLALHTGRHALDDAQASLDGDQFSRAVQSVIAAARVVLVGHGTSYPLAYDGARALIGVGIRAEAPAEVMAAHLAARTLEPGDVLVAISLTGATAPAIQAAEIARERDAVVVTISGARRSPLGRLADATLIVGMPDAPSPLRATAYRLAMMRVTHGLAMACARRSPSRAATAAEAAFDVNAMHHL
jgi:DNA-binding MurR/RpiR family transcriptional regulator